MNVVALISVLSVLGLLSGWWGGENIRKTTAKDWSAGQRSLLAGVVLLVGFGVWTVSGPLGFAIAALGAGLAMSLAGWPIILIGWALLVMMAIATAVSSVNRRAASMRGLREAATSGTPEAEAEVQTNNLASDVADGARA